MKTCLTLLLCAMNLMAFAQKLTLDECTALARKNYPLIKKYELIKHTERIDLSDIQKTWLPQIGVYAQGTVQNHVPTFPDDMLPMPANMGINMPGIRKDQYKVGVDVSQTIWDGGTAKADRAVSRAESQVQEAVNDVELYAVEERVQDLFFAVLLTEAQVNQNELTAKLLQSNLHRLQSMYANGTAMQSDVDVVEAEHLTVLQNLTRLRGTVDSYRQMLEVFIARPLSSTELVCPSAEVPVNLQPAGPELTRFDAELRKIESRRGQVKTTLLPRLGLFAQAYYGYPGYDYFQSMMTRDWDFNVMAGVKMSWTINSFYTHKNKLSKLAVASQTVENSRDVFLFNTRLTAIRQQNAIRQQQAVLAEDARIVELRTAVRKAAESRLANGVIDTTDLLRKITDESTAALNAVYHQIELVKNVYQLKHTLNR